MTDIFNICVWILHFTFENYIDNKDKLWLSIDIISSCHFIEYTFGLTTKNDDTDEEYECGNINCEIKIANKIENIEQCKRKKKKMNGSLIFNLISMFENVGKNCKEINII